jgi:alpha-D-xyloside xylohydrolase
VKENSLIPLAQPIQHVEEKSVFELTVKVFGKNPNLLTLFEDDGVTYRFEKKIYNHVTLSWADGKGHVQRNGSYEGLRYEIKGFEGADWGQVCSSRGTRRSRA